MEIIKILELRCVSTDGLWYQTLHVVHIILTIPKIWYRIYGVYIVSGISKFDMISIFETLHNRQFTKSTIVTWIQ